jgi:hypothetical protein
VRRRDESRVAEAKIQQLITTLDMRKDEAIERTFKVCHPGTTAESAVWADSGCVTK